MVRPSLVLSWIVVASVIFELGMVNSELVIEWMFLLR